MTLRVAPIDHIADGTSHVISQYKGKPRFLMRLASYLNSLQQAEDQLPLIHDAFRPDLAVGFRLDWVGAKVGQPRTGTTDADYRLYIKARIRANRSNGKIADLRAIMTLLTTAHRYYEGSVSVVLETPDELTSTEAEIIHSILQRAASAGVRVNLVSSTGDPGFSFSSVGSTLSVDGGFDSVSGAPAPSTEPGLFARVTQ
jgi:hypothetical protein